MFLFPCRLTYANDADASVKHRTLSTSSVFPVPRSVPTWNGKDDCVIVRAIWRSFVLLQLPRRSDFIMACIFTVMNMVN